MQLSGVGSENAKAFEPLMGALKYSDYLICVGAVEENEPAGVALFSELGGSLFLDYIFVSEKFRRRGIGTALVKETLKELEEVGFVALHVNYPERAEDIHGFIQTLDFKLFRDGVAYRTKIEDLLKSEVTEKLFKGNPKKRVVKLSDLTLHEKGLLKKALDKEELDPEAIDDSALSPKLSLATFDNENDAPAGLILCTQSRRTIVISYLVNFSKDASELLEILRVFKNTVEEENYTDNDLVFLTMNDEMVKLPEKLLESKELLHQEGAVISGIKMLSDERTIFAPLLREML
ncbi:MAG: GNAT family N-acetyltransferase [Lachnospiraceae bacterium]|nr:GNAT family N-acetyltransferase [Lachnospiraceae bacterium]